MPSCTDNSPRIRIKKVSAGSASIVESTLDLSQTIPPSPPPPPRVPSKPASDVVAGAVARAASQSTIHPIDTIKVRLQTHFRQATQSVVPKVTKPGITFANGQLKVRPAIVLRNASSSMQSLYKGVAGAACGAGIAIGAYFAVYGVACNTISRYSTLPNGGVAFVAGAIAAAGSSVVKVPIAVCVRSVQAGVYSGPFQAARQIVKSTGPQGLFTGYVPTLLEDVPDMAFKFAAYETLRSLHQRMVNGRKADVTEDFVMGAVAGAFAAGMTTPLDVVKTNMMCGAASRPSMMSATKAVMAKGGVKAFFNGVGPRAVSNGINSAVFFCFFEALKKAIEEKKARQAQESRFALAD